MPSRRRPRLLSTPPTSAYATPTVYWQPAAIAARVNTGTPIEPGSRWIRVPLHDAADPDRLTELDLTPDQAAKLIERLTSALSRLHEQDRLAALRAATAADCARRSR